MQEHATSDLAEETEDQDTQKNLSETLFTESPGGFLLIQSGFQRLSSTDEQAHVETDAGTLIYLFFQEGFISLC